MTSDDVFSLFKTFIWPSIRKLIEDMGLKLYTTSLSVECLVSDDSELIVNVNFLQSFAINDRDCKLVNQKLRGKLWNLFSEYSIVVNEIVCNDCCFPKLYIKIFVKELIECFGQVGKKQEDFGDEKERV